MQHEHTSLRGLPLTASASMIAGFFAAACSLPFDFVKTRIQRMKPDAQGKVPYAGFIDCFAKVRTCFFCGAGCGCVLAVQGAGRRAWSQVRRCLSLRDCVLRRTATR